MPSLGLLTAGMVYGKCENALGSGRLVQGSFACVGFLYALEKGAMPGAFDVPECFTTTKPFWGDEVGRQTSAGKCALTTPASL